MRLEALCRNISPALAAAPIKARQTCFRPVTEDGLPFIGAVPGVDGAYVATGHSVWGMLNAPATGEAMSELILDGAAQRVDLAPFAPGRLPPLDPARLRDLSEYGYHPPIEHLPAFDDALQDEGKPSRPEAAVLYKRRQIGLMVNMRTAGPPRYHVDILIARPRPRHHSTRTLAASYSYVPSSR